MVAAATAIVVACSRPRPPDAKDSGAANEAGEVEAGPSSAFRGAVAIADAAPARELSGMLWQMDLLDPPIDPFDAGAPKEPRHDGSRIGVVAVPLGAREPRPIMIALHGGSDQPDWACGAWR